MRAVAHQLDDAAVMLGQQRLDHIATERLQGQQGIGLVLLDKPGIAHDIRR